MNYDDIRDMREGFVDMGEGDGLVKWETRIVAVIIFILSLTIWDCSFIKSLIIAIVFAVLFPILIGTIPILGKIAAVFFSIVWAAVGWFIGAAILGTGVGIIAAILAGSGSFFCHRVFSGLGYASVEKIELDNLSQISSNTAQMAATSQVERNAANFCPNCGSQIKGGNFCPNCGNRI